MSASKTPDIPTLEDVAARAGVSTATVSRCLNDPAVVSEKTRAKVMEAVRTLGYAPNFGARALAARRTNTFGAVIPTMDNAIFARGLQAFQEVLGQEGVTVLVAASSYQPDVEEEQIRTLVTRGAEALLLIGHDRTDTACAFLKTQRIPHVVSWAHDPAASGLSVGFDNRRAMAALTREVLALGHTRIGFISAQVATNDRARARLSGLRDAMEQAGMAPQALCIEETPYGIDTGAAAFARMMDKTDRPTAVMCGNDVLAAGALMAARQMGVRVPQDVSITGFDDIDLAAIGVPGLTTVHVPHRDMGAQAAHALLALRAGEPVDDIGPLQTHVAWRESLGPAPSA